MTENNNSKMPPYSDTVEQADRLDRGKPGKKTRHRENQERQKTPKTVWVAQPSLTTKAIGG